MEEEILRRKVGALEEEEQDPATGNSPLVGSLSPATATASASSSEKISRASSPGSGSVGSAAGVGEKEMEVEAVDSQQWVFEKVRDLETLTGVYNLKQKGSGMALDSISTSMKHNALTVAPLDYTAENQRWLCTRIVE